MGEVLIKRVYDRPATADGYRVLVDRLWPRGVSHERAKLDGWLKDVAPRPMLRTWWDHAPAERDEFARRYRAELDGNRTVSLLRDLIREHHRVTLIYAARDPVNNHAAVLRYYLQQPDDRDEWNRSSVRFDTPNAALAAQDAEGGDPACWLSQVCPECGALIERPTVACWRCGRPATVEDS
jgi:uncharacterized protein YeaO (DUF488 family)